MSRFRMIVENIMKQQGDQSHPGQNKIVKFVREHQSQKGREYKGLHEDAYMVDLVTFDVPKDLLIPGSLKEWKSLIEIY